MAMENAPADLAARYGVSLERMVDENILLWEIIIALLAKIGENHYRVDCPDIHALGVEKLQVLKSFLNVVRTSQ